MASTAHSIARNFSLTFSEIYGQTSSYYGIGTPLVAVPVVYFELLLRSSGVIPDSSEISLLPLANSFLFALLGLLVAGVARRLGAAGGAGWTTGLLLIASPFLPISTTFYSEMLGAVGLVGLAWVLLGNGRADQGRVARATLLCAFVFAAAAALARSALLPGVGLLLFWGWRRGSSRGVFWAGVAGAAAAVMWTLIQNALLRGSLFRTGYEGQEFTTPLFNGLFGLLLSPERGLLIFFPLTVLLYGRIEGERSKGFHRLALGFLLFSLVFHASFWTWHGGWTIGPRFMLPALALAMPLVVVQLQQFQGWSLAKKLVVGAMVAWGLWGAILYSSFSPMGLWNELWGFHKVEARWMFEPQLSLWKNWQHLAPKTSSVLHYNLPRAVILFLAAGLSFGLTGRGRWRLNGALMGIWLMLALGFCLSGPRGWQGPDARLRYLRLQESEGAFSGLLDIRLPGTYTFAAKARGSYDVQLDGRTLLRNEEPIPQHLPRVEVELEPGLHYMDVEFSPLADGGIFYLYWSWPGEGRILEPVGGEYVLPRELRASERFFTGIWRHKYILISGAVALLLLLVWQGRSDPEK